MMEFPENISGQGGSATQASSLGSMLREARENLGLSVSDVAGQIKFAPKQIEALEADDYQHLPEPAFVRGFVRSYAKILKLDAEALLAKMPHAKAAREAELVPPSVGVPFPTGQANHQQNLIWLGAASFLAVVVVGFAVWHFKTPLKQNKVAQVETPVALPAETNIIPDQPGPKSSAAEPSETDELKVQSAKVQSSKAQSAKAQSAKVQSSKAMPAEVKSQVAKSPETNFSQEVKPEDAKLAIKSPDEKSPASKTSAEQSLLKEEKPQPKVKEAKTSAAKAASQDQASETLTSTSETSELRLTFGEESWTEIKDKDDKIISSQVNPAGSELRIEGKPPFSMLIGHAASASLYYRGKQVDLKPYINKYSEVAHVKLK